MRRQACRNNTGDMTIMPLESIEEIDNGNEQVNR